MLRNFTSGLTLEALIASQRVAAVLGFTNSPPESRPHVPSIRLELLGHAKPAFEVFEFTEDIVESGIDNDCVWRRSNHLQFTSISIEFDSDNGANNALEEASCRAYSKLLSTISNSPHPELVRFWNYIPNINHGAGDNENYKRFCNGRLQAFDAAGLSDTQFPAASAVGHYTSGITVCALTTSHSAEHHTNPRQVDAFKYPRQYGPSSPSFARATTLSLNEQRACFISGTASILGHSSVHRGDLRLQLYTTNDNILYLLKENSFKRSSIQTLRVYLRDPSDYLDCKRIVEELFPNTDALYLHADICRSDLLVEIECFCIAE